MVLTTSEANDKNDKTMCAICCENVPPRAVWKCSVCPQSCCSKCFIEHIRREEIVDLVCISSERCSASWSAVARCMTDAELNSLTFELSKKAYDLQSARFPEVARKIELRKSAHMYDEMIWDLQRRCEEKEKEVDALKKENGILKRKRERMLKGLEPEGPEPSRGASTSTKPTEVATTMLKCPHDDCFSMYRFAAGTLSTCIACAGLVCCDCGVGLKKDETKETHACNKEDVKSCALIRKTSRPCPKCGVVISKNGGCDHMFCTVCKYSFSYQTGKIIRHSFGNPHHDQYVRSLTDEQRARWMEPINRQMGDDQQFCEDRWTARDLSRRVGEMKLVFSPSESAEAQAFVTAVMSLLAHHFNEMHHRETRDENYAIAKRQSYYDKLNHAHMEFNEPTKDQYIKQVARYMKKYRREEEIAEATQGFMRALRRVVISMARMEAPVANATETRIYGIRRREFLDATSEFITVLAQMYVASLKDIYQTLEDLGSKQKSNALALGPRCADANQYKSVVVFLKGIDPGIERYL